MRWLDTGVRLHCFAADSGICAYPLPTYKCDLLQFSVVFYDLKLTWASSLEPRLNDGVESIPKSPMPEKREKHQIEVSDTDT